MYRFVNVMTLIVSFCICYYTLYQIDFSKILEKSKKPYVVFLLALGLGYLVGKFILEITVFY